MILYMYQTTSIYRMHKQYDITVRYLGNFRYILIPNININFMI